MNHIVIALISNTYSTNASNTGIALDDRNDFHVNLLKEQSEFILVGKKKNGLKRIFFLGLLKQDIGEE